MNGLSSKADCVPGLLGLKYGIEEGTISLHTKESRVKNLPKLGL